MVERAIYPLLVASQSVPKIAIAPLLIFWAGSGRCRKVLVAFLISFFPIIIDTVVGLRSVEPEMLHLARSMGAGRAPHLPQDPLPVRAAEHLCGAQGRGHAGRGRRDRGRVHPGRPGLGYALLQANAVINTKLGFAAIIVLAALGVAMFVIVDVIERRLIPWHVSHRSDLIVGTP